MKSRTPLDLVHVARGAAILCLLLALVPSSRAEFKAAAASRDVTPELLLPITSGGPGRPSKEKIGVLEARVLVLENDGVRVAFVSEPFLGFPAALCRRVTDRVKSIPAENILIGATHVHSAPDPYGFPGFGKGADLDYLDSSCARTAEAIEEAVANLKPAKLKIATGRAAEKIAYNYYAPNLYDRRASVMQAIDAATGEPISTLVNYAVHPEIFIDRPAISPDLIGPFHDRIAELGGGVAVFMNGAQGGMITADCRGPDGKDVQTWEECVRIGNLLAEESLRIVADAVPQADPKIVNTWENVNFPIGQENPMWRVMSRGKVGFKINDDNTITTRLNLVNVGNAQILTIPGEALPNIGFYLKRKMHGEHNLLFGLTNDAFGYILTKVDFNSFDRYEYISQTSLGEMTGEVLIEKGLALADRAPRPEKLAPAPEAAATK